MTEVINKLKVICPDCSGGGTVMKRFYIIDPSDGSDSEVGCETCTPENTILGAGEGGDGFIYITKETMEQVNKKHPNYYRIYPNKEVEEIKALH